MNKVLSMLFPNLYSVDYIVSKFNKTVARLDRTAHLHKDHVVEKQAFAKKLLDEATAHHDESQRADRIAAKIKELVQ
jgi:hypothetical protein